MSNSVLSATRFKVIFGICWLVLMTDHVLVLNLFGLPWQQAIADSIISNTVLLLTCLAIINSARYYLPQRNRYVNIFASAVILSILSTFLTRFLLRLALDHYAGYEFFMLRSLPIRFSITFLLLGCINMICVLWHNWEEQKESEERKVDTEKLTKEAELFKLRQQLHPHFLFNSLNSINALIGTRPVEARKMVQQLSDFLRGTLKKEDAQWVNIEEEIQYLQLYLDIEKVRFGNRLITIIETPPSPSAIRLPALLLQPIVENAIKFGLYDTTGETIIRISTFTEDNYLVIQVSNPYDPETSSSQQGTGFGLTSVNRRLYLLFARRDLLSTKAADNIFVTTVKIPQHAQSDPD